MSENCEQVTIEEQPVSEKRRCEHTKEGGRRCLRWASRGENLCHSHLRYAEACGRRRIDVPLLEDEASIVYALSQTAQALAVGQIPPANGQAVISACKLAARVLELQFKQAQWKAKNPASPAAREPEPPQPQQPQTEQPDQPDQAEEDDSDLGEALAGDEPLMAVCDEGDDEPVAADGPGAFDRAVERVRTQIETAAAESYAQQGPTVDLPRFRKPDLEEEWESGMTRPWTRNETNTWLSKEEKAEILEWQSKNWRTVRAQHDRMLDEYFGRVKKEETPGANA